MAAATSKTQPVNESCPDGTTEDEIGLRRVVEVLVFQDLGPTYIERRNRETIARRSIHRLEALGYTVTVNAIPA